MNYSDIERQTFKTFLAFSTVVLTFLIIFFYLSSTLYRVSAISYIENEDLDYSSINRLIGISIWLVDDYYFQDFYNENPTVESISISKQLPNTLITNVIISEQIAFIEDRRQVPSMMSVLYKNLHIETITSHVGKNPHENHGIPSPPVYRTSTILNKTMESYKKSIKADSKFILSSDSEYLKFFK